MSKAWGILTGAQQGMGYAEVLPRSYLASYTALSLTIWLPLADEIQ